MLQGFCGTFVRGVLEDRVERQKPLIVRGLRARLESGNPPDVASDPFGKKRLGCPLMDETSITLFFAGDVMTGRGVDQILARPSAPELHEPYVTDAREYVRLAEQVSGPVPRQVAPDYIWGDAIAEWERMAPPARVVNLETSITRSDDCERKGINYRMHPDNIGCLRAAHPDVCIFANNARWLGDKMNEISRGFATHVTLTEHGALRWRHNDAA